MIQFRSRISLAAPLFAAALLALAALPLSASAAGSILEPLYMGGADRSGLTNSGTEANGYFGLAMYENYAITITTTGNGTCGLGNLAIGCEIHIYDVSQPDEPTFVAGIDASGAVNSGSTSDYYSSIRVEGDYLYATKNPYSFTDCSSTNKLGCELQIYDISDPTAPVFVTGIDATGGVNSGMGTTILHNIEFKDNYMYVVKERSANDCASSISKIGCELQIFDITDISAPVFVAGVDSSGQLNTGTSTSWYREVALEGDVLVVGTQSYSLTACATNNRIACEIHIYDISSSTAPVFLAGIDSTANVGSGSGGSTIKSLILEDGILYAALDASSTNCNTSGNKIGCELQIYDLSDPANPVFISGIDNSAGVNTGTGSNSFNDIEIEGTTLAIAKSSGTALNCNTAGNKVGCDIMFFDITDPAAPVYLVGLDAGGLVATGTANKSFYGIDMVGDYMYLASHGGGYDVCSQTIDASGCDLMVFQIGEPDAPSIGVTAPAAAASVPEGAFAAVIDWDVATTCSYSYDQIDWTAVDCDEAGDDIPAPPATGSVTLYVRASQYGSQNDTGSVTFTYAPPASESEEEPSRSSSRRGSSIRSRVTQLTNTGNTAQAQALMQQWTAIFSGPATTPAAESPTISSSVRDLESGLSGDDVRQLQEMLISAGYAIPAGATGYFANQTQAALAAYQAASDITPSVGYFGPITRAQMTAAGIAGRWW